MRTMADANFDRWREENIAQGVKQGMAQGVAQGRIALLGRLAARRFGDGVAGRVTALLADVSDTSRLDAAGEWLVGWTRQANGSSTARPARRCSNGCRRLPAALATARRTERLSRATHASRALKSLTGRQSCWRWTPAFE